MPSPSPSTNEEFILTLQTPDLTRTVVVPPSFEISAAPGAAVWLPSDTLASVLATVPRPRFEIVDAERVPALKQGRRVLGPAYTAGDTTLSVARLPPDLASSDGLGALVGSSLAMRRFARDIRAAGSSDAVILIQGETGTGKELVARTLHERSSRRAKPYTVIDCTAISESLFESELFGHVKGAFSGATIHRAGPFEASDGGTVFIDELGEIPLTVQAKLLRVLESGTVRRVGDNAHRTVDVRIIGATHRDLHAMVQDGRFRADLYYRLAVLELHAPPLRERHGDLVHLLRAFVGAEWFGELTEAQWEAIERHPWNGNIRELKNFVQKGLFHGWNALFEPLRTSGRRIGADAEVARGGAGRRPARSISEPPNESAPTTRFARDGAPRRGETLADYRARWLRECEQAYLRAVLSWSRGNVTTAATIAGVNRSHFHRMMRKCGLSRPEGE